MLILINVFDSYKKIIDGDYFDNLHINVNNIYLLPIDHSHLDRYKYIIYVEILCINNIFLSR